MQSKFVGPVENLTQTVVNPARETKKAWEAIKKDDLGISKSLEGVIASTSTPGADALKLYEHYVSLFLVLAHLSTVQFSFISNARRSKV